MKFNSAICTSVEQSKRLLELGIKKETADMWHYKDSYGWRVSPVEEICDEKSFLEYGTPAWSLHRLIELAEVSVEIGGLWIKISGVYCYEEKYNVYDNLIDAIKELINHNVFNKDYLEEKK